MSKTPLRAYDLSSFLESKGLIIRKRFWEQVEEECSRSVVSERNLVFDWVPWNGLIVISISFSKGDVHQQLYGNDWEDVNIDSNALYVNGIIVEIKYFAPGRISLSAKKITSNITFPTYSVRLIAPSLRDVERCWEVMFSIGKEFEKYNHEQSANLEHKIESLLDI